MTRSIILQREDTLKKLKCQKCEYEWFPNIPDTKPKVCPRCKSYAWNGPYNNKPKP